MHFDEQLQTLILLRRGFLEKIKQPESDYSGALIDKIFIPPDEFNEIKEKLEKDRFVFITGTAGYGKTYTAIRLLWEWYNKEDNGYIPEWVPGKELEDRIEAREKLASIDGGILKPHHIIYFEDPFGKTKYERRDDLKGRINFIINYIKNKKDVYVIVTARKDVFEAFDKESYSVEQIKKFEEELNILKPSYSYKKKKQILEKWAEEKACKWLKDEKLKKIVFDSLKYEEILSTPLSIHDFSEATVNIEEELGLKQKIEDYSKANEIAFADEIKGLYDSGRVDRVLLLSFIFVSENFGVGFVKQEYNKLKKENFEDFETILKEEYRIKVEDYAKIIKFSHPSYSKALPYVLNHKGCKNTFCELFREILKYDSTVRDIALTVTNNLEKFHEDVRNGLLLKLSERREAAENVAKTLTNNLEKFHEDVRNELLLKLSERREAAKIVAKTLTNDFDKFPEDVRNELLLKLSENKEAARIIAWAVITNFGKISKTLRNELLLKLSKKDDAARTIAWAVTNSFAKLPEDVRNELLLKLSEKDKDIWNVGWAVEDNFDKLPGYVRNKLLLRLSKKDETYLQVARIVANNFDKLPEDVRNDLLLSLSEKDLAALYVARTVANNFDMLPEDVRNKLLFTLSDKYEAYSEIAKTIAINFDRLPEDVRNLLDKLQKPLQQIIEDLSKDQRNREFALQLISNAWSKINLVFALNILNKLSKSKDKRLETKVEEIQQAIFNITESKVCKK